MGIGNAHTSVGNIMSLLVASALSKYGRVVSFVVPRLIIVVIWVIVFLVLSTCPENSWG